MNESLARKFCESPFRSLIVTITTIVLLLVTVLPMVDEYFDGQRSRRALVEDLARANETAKSLPTLEQRVAALNDRLANLETRAVNKKGIGNYRTRLVELVRESGCQMRRIDVSGVNRRGWMEDDSPLVERVPSGKQAKPTPYVLERRSVMLSVDGSTANVSLLLGKIIDESKLMHPRHLKFQSAGRSSNKVTMEIELWLFALEQKPV